MGHRLLLAAIAASLCSEAVSCDKHYYRVREAVNSGLPDPSWIVPFDGDLIGIAKKELTDTKKATKIGVAATLRQYLDPTFDDEHDPRTFCNQYVELALMSVPVLEDEKEKLANLELLQEMPLESVRVCSHGAYVIHDKLPDMTHGALRYGLDAAESFDRANIPVEEYGKSLPPTFRFYYKLTLKAWAEFHSAIKATRSQALSDVSKVQAPKACKLQAKESGDWDKPAEWASGGESGVLVSAKFRGTSSRLLKAGGAAHPHQQVLDARSEGAAPAAAEAVDPMALLEMEVMAGLHLGEDASAGAAADVAAGVDLSVEGSVAAPAFFAGGADPRFDLGSVGISRLSVSLSAWTQRLMDVYKQHYRWRINIPIPTVLLANCLAYATVSHYFLGNHQRRYCHPGQASADATHPALNSGAWMAHWAAHNGGARNIANGDMNLAPYLADYAGAGSLRVNNPPAGICGDLLASLQRDGLALAQPTAAWHEVDIFGHRQVHLQAAAGAPPVGQAYHVVTQAAHATPNRVLQVAANTPLPANTIMVSADSHGVDYHFHRRNTNDLAGNVRWSDKNGATPVHGTHATSMANDDHFQLTLGYANLEHRVVLGTTVTIGTAHCGTLWSQQGMLAPANMGGTNNAAQGSGDCRT